MMRAVHGRILKYICSSLSEADEYEVRKRFVIIRK